jgi:ketosteroid isomerase-like protein
MKRSSFVALSLLLYVCVLSGCQPAAAPETNRNAGPTNAVPKETINTAAIEAEILKLETDWAAAAMRHDAETVRGIVADDVVMTYPDGNTGTKADELRVIESAAITAEGWEVLDTKVTVLDADTAFITGRSVMKNAKYKDAASKTTVDISGQYRFTDVYERRNGKWQAVASQTTKIQNPAPSPSPVPSPKVSPSVPPPPTK